MSQPDGKMDVLLDIELPVTLRFGRTQMLLGDVIALGSGSVIEFDRSVDEPVEVLVNGRVVARGEAVMVQGNYGVRVSEIVSRRAPGPLEPASQGNPS
jgi:flagellar motor switch protein FliN/FliY